MDVVGYADNDTTTGGVLAVAHRGGAGCCPENSLKAFRHAVGLGVRWLETDVRATRDGVAVLHHDRSLRRLFGLRAGVADLTWEQLRALRTPTGERVLRPADVLGDLPGARLVVDVKDARALPGLLADVRRARAAARVCLAGAPDDVLAAAVSQEPALHRALGWRSLVRLVTAGRAGLPGWCAGQPPARARWAHVPDRLLGRGVCTAEVVARARDLGVGVLVWTVDDPARMHELLDLGVAGVITDEPAVLRDVLADRLPDRLPDRLADRLPDQAPRRLAHRQRPTLPGCSTCAR